MAVSSGGGLLGCCACVAVLSVFLACGGGGGSRTPTQPSTPAPPANQWTMKGRVVETLTDAPIAGAKLTVSLTAGNREVVTGGDGSWEMSQASSEGVPAVEVSADGYVTRRTYLRWNTGTRADIVIDLIKDAAPFSLDYYRALVRNQFEAPETLQPLRRWTKNPNFYIYKLNPVTGQDISTSDFELLVSSIRAAVLEMTDGRLQAGAIDHGSEERPEQAGYITVKFESDAEAEGYCGRARVGADPGLITITYGADGCDTPCGPFAPLTVAHEVGHAMGYWHVPHGDVMQTLWYRRDCARTALSAAERHHSRIAYTRAPGNLDTDWDPVSAALLRAPAGPPPVVSCR